jgi:hypothetical protein
MARGSGNGRGAGPAGSRLRYGNDGRPKRVKTGGHQWSDEAEAEFFDHLAATCNVRASAEAVGFTTFTVYRQRRLRPDFAAKWQAVLEHGVARLRMELLRSALDTLAGEEFDPDRPIPPMTAEQAMNLLKLHQAEARGERGGRPGRFATPRGFDHHRASILRKLEAIRDSRDPPGGEAPSNEAAGGQDG